MGLPKAHSFQTISLNAQVPMSELTAGRLHELFAVWCGAKPIDWRYRAN
jgi:hypothetical protein